MSLTPPKSLGQPTCSAKNTDLMICSILVSVTWEECYFEQRWVLPCRDFAPHEVWNLVGEGWVLGRSCADPQLCVQPFSLLVRGAHLGESWSLDPRYPGNHSTKPVHAGGCTPSVRGSCWLVQGIKWGWKKQLLLCLSASFFILNTSLDWPCLV